MIDNKNKLLVCDLDGTLLDAKGNIDQESLENIKKFCEDGGHFVVCTGRMDSDILYVEEKLGCKSDFRISQNGTVIKDRQDKIVSLHTIPTCYVPVLNKIIFSKNLRTEVSNTTNRFFPSPRSPENVAEFIDTSIIVSDLESRILKEKELTIYLTFGTKNDFKIIREEIEESLGKDALNIVMTSSSSLEVFSKKASKGIAVSQVQKLLTIGIENTFVAGDAESDISMFVHSKNSFAVREAAENIRQKANHYVKTVGDVVKYIYGQENHL